MALLIDWRRVEARRYRQELWEIADGGGSFAGAIAGARGALCRNTVRPLAVRPLLPPTLNRSGARFAHDTHAANLARRPLFVNRPRHD